MVIIIDKRVVDSDNTLFQVNVAPAKPGDLTDSHPRVCHNIEHWIPVGVLGVAEHIVKERYVPNESGLFAQYSLYLNLQSLLFLSVITLQAKLSFFFYFG